MTIIQSLEQLNEYYDAPGEASLMKVTPVITQEYRELIEASPFLALATCGPEGLDCSPRGDRESVVRISDEKTVHLPDRRGNNRLDSLRNIVRDPRVALLFFLPGSGNTIRINGTASVNVDPGLLNTFAVEEQPPRSVIVVEVAEVYFQCARAIVRSDLWNPDNHVDLQSLPTAGCILGLLSDNRIDGQSYDSEWPERARKTLW